MYFFVKNVSGTNDVFHWHVPFSIIPTYGAILNSSTPGLDKEEILDLSSKSIRFSLKTAGT